MLRYDEFAAIAPIRLLFYLWSVHWLHVINVIVDKVAIYEACKYCQAFRPSLLLM